MTLKVFSDRVSDPGTQILHRSLGKNLQMNETMSCRALIEIKTVEISVFFIYNRQGCRRCTGGCNRWKGKYRNTRLICSSFCCIQYFSPAHTKNHIGFADTGIFCPSMNIRIGTILSKKYRICNLQTAVCNRCTKQMFCCLQSFFPSDQKNSFSKSAAYFRNLFIDIGADRIICKIYRIRLHLLPFLSSNFRIMQAAAPFSPVCQVPHPMSSLLLQSGDESDG